VDTSGILIDGFDRIAQTVHRVLDGLDADAAVFRIDDQANSIAWLVWHLTRVQDDHVADAAQSQQVWTTGGWVDRFGLPFAASATGYGQDFDEVAAVRVPADLLAGYHDAVHDRTVEYLRTLTADDLDRVVDTRWDPPVTLAVRLVSVISDDLQHVGQAAFVQGIAERAGRR
jgi:uncharacterized damage-inducible protein DinB